MWSLTTAGPDGSVVVHVGTSLERVGEATAVLRGSLAVGVPAALALLVPGLWLVIGRALRPVEAMRAEVAEISGGRLDRRVPVPATGRRAGPPRRDHERHARPAGGGRAAPARVRRRRLPRAASPLAGFRAHLEVSLAHPDGTDWRVVARDLLADSDAMERVVADLLYLRAGRRGARGAPDDAGRPGRRRPGRGGPARGVGVRVDTGQVSAAPVRGSVEELRRLVRNAVDNAVQHASAVVRLRLGVEVGEVVLAVEDDGPGVPEADRERVFERFVRLDGARSRGQRRDRAGAGDRARRRVAARRDRRAGVRDRTGDRPDERPDDRGGDRRAAGGATAGAGRRRARAPVTAPAPGTRGPPG